MLMRRGETAAEVEAEAEPEAEPEAETAAVVDNNACSDCCTLPPLALETDTAVAGRAGAVASSWYSWYSRSSMLT